MKRAPGSFTATSVRLATRRAKVVMALVSLTVLAAACGSTTASPTSTSATSPVAKGVLSTTQLRTRYLQDSADANAAFASFTSQFSGSSNGGAAPTVASPAEAKAASAAAKVLQKSASALYALSSEAPRKTRADLRSLIAAESPVFQALLDLAASYHSRAFDLAAWSTSLGNAAALTDQAAQRVAQDLKIPASAQNG